MVEADPVTGGLVGSSLFDRLTESPSGASRSGASMPSNRRHFSDVYLTQDLHSPASGG